MNVRLTTEKERRTHEQKEFCCALAGSGRRRIASAGIAGGSPHHKARRGSVLLHEPYEAALTEPHISSFSEANAFKEGDQILGVAAADETASPKRVGSCPIPGLATS